MKSGQTCARLSLEKTKQRGGLVSPWVAVVCWLLVAYECNCGWVGGWVL
jgi:hypothetical protein